MGIPRYTMKEYELKAKRENKAKWLTPKGFVTRPRKSKAEEIIDYPPPLSKAQKSLIQNTKWHEDKERSKMAMIKRSDPRLLDPNKPVFQPRVPAVNLFSKPKPLK